MKKNEKTKKIRRHSDDKFGVFNGNVINSETLVQEHKFVINEYRDDNLTITSDASEEIKAGIVNVKTSNVYNKKAKRKNPLIFKLTLILFTTVVIISMIVFLVIKLT